MRFFQPLKNCAALAASLAVAALLLAAAGGYEACAAPPARKAVKMRPHKYVDKFLLARQRHARLARAGLAPAAIPALSSANYHKDAFAYDDKGIAGIIRRSNPQVPLESIAAYCRHIVAWAKHYKLPPLLVASVIHVESRFRESSSYLGNYGPMQVNLTVHKERLKKMGISVDDLKTIDKGVQAGCSVLIECILGSGGDYNRALTWYNGAMNPRYAASVLEMYAYGKAAANKERPPSRNLPAAP